MMEPQNCEASESHLNTEPQMSKSTPIGVLQHDQKSENVQTVLGLKQELGQLRESTKDALQQSWEEVEQLREKAAAYLKRANSLERELEILRSREQKLIHRCDEQMATIEMYKRREQEMKVAQATAEITMQRNSEEERSAPSSTATASTENQQNTDSSPATETPKKHRRNSLLRSIISRRPSLVSQISLSKISNTPTAPQQQDENQQIMDQSDSNHSSRSDDYWLKLSEEIIKSSICPNSDRTEMETKLAQHLTKIDKDRQKELATIIEVYQNRVNEKKKIIVEQREKISDYKAYITGLTNELERVCSEQNNDDGPNFYHR